MTEPTADHAAWLRSYVKDTCEQVLRLLSDGQVPRRISHRTLHPKFYLLLIE